MEHIFYFGAVLFAIYELYYLSSVERHIEENKDYYDWYKENKGINFDDMPEDKRYFSVRKLLILIPIMVWLFVGLMSSQWIAFAFFIIVNILLYILRKPFKDNKSIRIGIAYVNTVIGFIFSLFVIINKYHLKINLFEWLKQLF